MKNCIVNFWHEPANKTASQFLRFKKTLVEYWWWTNNWWWTNTVLSLRKYLDEILVHAND